MKQIKSWFNVFSLFVIVSMMMSVVLVPGGTLQARASAAEANVVTAQVAADYTYEPIEAAYVDLANITASPEDDPAGAAPEARFRADAAEVAALKAAALNLPATDKVQMAESGAGTLAPVPGTSFDSLDTTECCGGGSLVPPDPDMAAGPNHLIAIVNKAFEIYDKNGTTLVPPTTLASFFSPLGGACVANPFDPTVVYDEEAGRWAIGADGNGTHFCIAVSQTGDPTGAYNMYAVPAQPWGGEFHDYPHMGVGDSYIVVGANQFGGGIPGGFEGRVWALDKADMYAGGALTPVTASTGLEGTPQPLNLHGFAQGTWPSYGSTHYFATDPYDGCTLNIWQWDVPNAPTIVSTMDLCAATGVVGGMPVDFPQQGGNNIQANDWRMRGFEYRNGSGWVADSIACNPGGGTVDCVRWTEVDLLAGPPALVQAGVYASDNEYRTFPDLAVNACSDMAVGYTKSNSAMFPGIWYTGRESGDPLGTLQPEAELKAGEVTYTAFDTPPHRWGDYTGMTIDPDGVTFWYLGEYSKDIVFSAKWGTYVGSFTYPNCQAGPDIVVDPTSLSDTLEPNTMVTHTLTISNVGGLTLTWTITEESMAPLAPVTGFTPGSSFTPEAIPGSELEEADTAVFTAPQAPGEEVKAVPYAYPEAVLYDNGPLVNCVGCGVGGADESILQSVSLGMNVLGFGHQAAADNRIADDFTVTDMAGWTLDAITFFAYQTGSGNTSTITETNLQIWDGPPDDPASQVIWGDTTTNVMVDTSWSNIYRVTETTSGGNTDRPIMVNVTDLGGLYLPQGTYWLDWQADGTLASGPWAPPITINGQTTTGNALQYTSSSGSWNPALDSGTGTQQGFPFIIEGDVGDPCDPADIPWASAQPISGTVGPGGAMGLEVTFDATGLSDGIYNGNLCIASNDPDEPFVHIPLELIVDASPRLAYDPSMIEVGMTLGDMLTRTLVVANTGSESFDFVLGDVETGFSPAVMLQSPATTCPADAFGYTCTDSTEPDNLVAYDFEDISAIGTAFILGDDQMSGMLPIGFSFGFYGTGYKDIYVSSNGFLSVLPGQSSGCCTGQVIPTAGNPDGVIAGWWEDLDPGEPGAELYYATLGTAPFRRFIVQFTNVQHWPSGNPVTFQYKLFEGSNNIEVHYMNAASDGGTHSVGIENESGSVGLQYYRGTAALGSSLAVCFLYPGQTSCGNGGPDAPWVYEMPISGTLDVGMSIPVDVVFDASVVLQTGTYSASLYFGGTFENAVMPGTLVMHVITETFGIEFDKTVGTDPNACATVDEITVVDGTEVTYCFTVTNTGELTFTTHDLVDSELGAILNDFMYDLAPGASVWLTQTVTITATTMNMATWTAANGPFVVEASDSATVNVIPVEYGVELSPDEAMGGTPGEMVAYTLRITNTGNVADTFDLGFSGNTWTMHLPETQVTLDAGAWADFIVHVTIPAGATGGDFDVATITATSQNDAMASDSADLTTTVSEFRIFLPIVTR